MAQVTAQLAGATDADVHAMAVYIASLMGISQAPAPQPPTQPILTSGDSLARRNPLLRRSTEVPSFTPPPVRAATSLGDCRRSVESTSHKSTAAHADSAQNIVNMVLFGLPAAEGRTGAIMPGFAGTLNQADVVALLSYPPHHLWRW